MNKGPGPLIKLTIEGFRGIAEFDVEPNGNSLEIFGDNGVGKSSATEALAWALGEDVDGEIIRNDSDKAVVGVRFGTYEVRRSKTRTGKPSLVVKEGKDTKGSPTALLAGLRGTIGRRTFSTMAAADQVATIKKLAPGLDTGKLDARRKELYDARHQIGLEVKAKGDPGEALAEMKPEEIGAEKSIVDVVDVAAIAEKKAKAAEQKAENDKMRRLAEERDREAREAQRLASEAVEEVRRLEKLLAEARETSAHREAEQAQAAERAKAARQAAQDLVDPDTSEIDAEIAAAREKNRTARAEQEAHNRAVRERAARAADIRRQNAERERKVVAIEADKARYAEHTKRIDAIDAEKLKQITDAAKGLPVEGLSIVDGKVMIDDGDNGLVEARVGILNDAACIELDVRMAAAQGHRLVTIRNAERLGKAARARIDALAIKHGIQTIREVVRDGAPLTAEIVDADPEAVAAVVGQQDFQL